MKKILHKNIDDKLFKEAWQLYESSFPKEEKRTLSTHKQSVRDSRFSPTLYVGDKNKLVAICFYWNFSDFIYFEHFAVDESYRNKGVGSIIISEFKESLKPVILEIEKPDNEIANKRLQFYKRNGFLQTNYYFKQLKYRKSNKDLFLNLLCNKYLNANLYDKFETTIYQELNKYCEI